ncbi:MAG: PepSY domain-containing protein [Pseudomonadota bacterium]|nr:PepSY domain-containing protein [Pseudomonadota bacterium]
MLKTRFSLALALAASSTAFAGGDKCSAGAKEQWQPIETLEKKLIAEGWKIKKAKIDSGCYEVYGTDAQGKRVEVYFNPKTLEPVKG